MTTSFIHFQSANIGSALEAMDTEARRRGHRVVVQEVYRIKGDWMVHVWAKGAEDYDQLYERLFRTVVTKEPNL